MTLPPGQIARADFPRFGLPPYAEQFPGDTDDQSITFAVNGDECGTLHVVTSDLAVIDQESDFHCVTTWSHCGLVWSGVRFGDFFDEYVRRNSAAPDNLAGAVFFAQDGYRTAMTLSDLMSENVMLAYKLNGQPLSIEHGAPIRLIAPGHYGYKNLKHLKRIEFHDELPVIKRGVRAFLDHPRARVSREERGRWIPGWILRYVYRPLISGTVREFHDAMQKYERNK